MDRVIEKKKWPPKKIAAIAGGGFLLFMILYVFVFMDRSSRLFVQEERLTISTVQRGEFQEWIPTNGTVLPIKTVYLDAVEGGVVEELLIEEGSYVTKGDPILVLANTNLLLDIMYREAELFQQINNLRNTRIAMEQRRLELQAHLLDLDFSIKEAKRDLKRNESLNKNKLVPVEDYNRAVDNHDYLINKRRLTLENYTQDSLFRQVQIQSLENSVERMQSNLDIVRKKQDNLTIRATISGQLTSLNAEIGQSKPQGTRIGQIDVLDGFKVRCAIDEHFIARVTTGQQGRFTFANNDYTLSSDKVYPEVTNGRFEVDMIFDHDTPEGLRRGQTLRVRFELSAPDTALLLSKGGFYQSTGGRWVYLLQDDGKTAIRQPISLGQQNTEVYEVLDGLEPGDRVITSSYENYGDVEKLVLKK